MIDNPVIARARKAFDALVKAARAGDDEAQAEIEVMQITMLFEYEDTIVKRIREGKESTHHIRALFEMADFAIPTLLWLANKHPEKLRPFAGKRLVWPAYVGRSAIFEEEYRALLGTCNQAGEWIDLGPLNLAGDLPFRVNRKTRNGILLAAAIRAIRFLTVDYLDDPKASYYLVRFAPNICRSDEREKRNQVATAFLKSIGPLNESNWEKWEPVLEHVLTIMYGPKENRSKLLPRTFAIAERCGHDGRYLKNLRNAKPIQSMTQFPEIRTIANLRKTSHGQWNDIKNQILRRCKSLAI